MDAKNDIPDAAILPDGSAFAVLSMPLPKDHWLYADRTYDLNKPHYEPDELPEPILTHAVRDTVVAAIRYAVRGATMCGKEEDFDPDALVQNAVYALCGPFGGLVETAQPDERAAFETQWNVLLASGAHESDAYLMGWKVWQAARATAPQAKPSGE